MAKKAKQTNKQSIQHNWSGSFGLVVTFIVALFYEIIFVSTTI
jgi:hypothetical protein